LATQPGVVALGETGLDYYRDRVGRDRQRELFRFHLDLARRLARELRIPRVRFVDVRPSIRLLATGTRALHLAIAEIRPSRLSGAAADPTNPEPPSGQAGFPRRGTASAPGRAPRGGRRSCT